MLGKGQRPGLDEVMWYPRRTPIFSGVGEAPSPFVTSHEELHFPKKQILAEEVKDWAFVISEEFDDITTRLETR